LCDTGAIRVRHRLASSCKINAQFMDVMHFFQLRETVRSGAPENDADEAGTGREKCGSIRYFSFSIKHLT
jgi:hypothetical protein